MTRTLTNFQILKFVLSIFLGWKAALSLVAFLGFSLLPTLLPGDKLGWANSFSDFWIRWANWDGGHFKGIAENGYLHSFQVVFFPLYPLLVRMLMILGIPSLWSGIFVSNISLIVGLFYLYKLVALDFEEIIAVRVIILILFFPTAFYFNAFYSESLFLSLTVSAFYYARKKRWMLAIAIASFSAVTRLIGIIVILSIAIEYFINTTRFPSIKYLFLEFLNRITIYLFLTAFAASVLFDLLVYEKLYLLAGLSRMLSIFLSLTATILLTFSIVKSLSKRFEYKKLITPPGLAFAISLIPFFGYCLFLYYTQDNFLAFISHEQQWARHLTLPWSGPINYFRDLLNSGAFRISYTTQRLVELLSFIMITISMFMCLPKLRLSYIFYFAVSLLIPLLTGTLQAIHRYALVIFPLFIILALIKNEIYYHFWLLFSLTLLGFFTVLFINNYWVS